MSWNLWRSCFACPLLFPRVQKKRKSKVIIHWIRHAQSCSNVEVDSAGIIETGYKLTSQPPLTELGFYQAIQLGKVLHHGDSVSIQSEQELVPIDDGYDEYFCSPSTRTILTLMIGLESKYAHNPKPIIYVNIVVNQWFKSNNYHKYILDNNQNPIIIVIITFFNL